MIILINLRLYHKISNCR